MVKHLPLLLLFGQLHRLVEATVSCITNEECEETLLPGSECSDGVCTNPFYSRGCLASHMDFNKLRVCSSDDPPEAQEMGFCSPSPFDYLEVRILGQDFESAFFASWIFQIVLSEVLGVPTSVETGSPGMSMDFYDRKSSMGFGTADSNYNEVDVASKVGDCRNVKGDSTNYVPCAHFVPEAWRAQDTEAEVETPKDLGALGSMFWYIPRFTAAKYPEFVSSVGLVGEKNRKVLADIFKRPTTWKRYCEGISNSSCVGDNVAARAPMNEMEEGMYYSEDLFSGYFEATEDNDCDAFPDTCTGHIADFPCTWLTYTLQQTHHLGIGLESNGPQPNGGYSSDALQQIWTAANYTKSDVIMMWYAPDRLYESFVSTDGEFTRVVLPSPTQECVRARADISTLCGDDREAMIGDPDGACDHESYFLKKVLAGTFQELSTGNGIDAALQSPAYDVLAALEITTLQYGEMFQAALERGTDPSNFDPRDAACRWVVENYEYVQSLVPESFPRVIREEDNKGDALSTFAIILACVALLLVLISGAVTYTKRKTKTMYYAQVPFLMSILAGMLLVSLCGLILPLTPTAATCVSIVWLSNLGYGLQLVPLAMRTYAINKLASSGKRMQRARLDLMNLAQVTLVTLCLVVAFLIFWTVDDPPEVEIQYELTTSMTDNDETVVVSTDYCGSDSEVWWFLAVAWQVALLFPAFVIAFVASLVNEDLNDTNALGLALGAHLVFVILQAVVIGLGEDNRSDTMQFLSLILSIDTIVSLFLYFLPKFLYSGEEIETEILPDLFLNTTVMIADIQGFTAWSSVREPIQVFKFLETLFERFDSVAERHQVFKVETTGECYVAASGIPDAKSDHALVMARFASECMKKMDILSKKLELQFGPDTCDLTLRIGLHSGPVTGGFMKGKHSRFQLFGDTMTTTSVIHETGESNRIHMSERTADLLLEAGRKKWVEKRDIKIHTVEKGDMQTYWLNRYRRASGSEGGSNTNASDFTDEEEELLFLDSEQRWIEWNLDVLRRLLKNIVAQRQTATSSGTTHAPLMEATGDMPLEEVQEIIELPEFDRDAARRRHLNLGRVEIDGKVVEQLRDLVARIAGMYNQNPFHNFAHASYVVMAVTKYMNRIVAASEVDVGNDEDHRRTSTHEAIHDHTYGITSDPLTQFACVFSALIHDVDHPGVPNAQLSKEDKQVTSKYKGRSLAEQKSFDKAWALLVDPEFDELRGTICRTEEELHRFRQLVVNSVMATDLADQELKALRNGRWSKAFSDEAAQKLDTRQDVNRKATIVIEHLIQSADVAHTCQHWGIYRKWNERLFGECYKAYKEGRAEKNPGEYWYEGEIGFFDFYVIPLSKKLRDCGVFGPTSDENLNYAQNNRAMWVKEGEGIVAGMLEALEEVEGLEDDAL